MSSNTLAEPALGLRDRKKRERHRALAAAARQLTLERGLDAVTVEDIAAAADVSVRTFHNYFSCKEEAVVGLEPSVLSALAQELLDRPADEAPIDAVIALVAPEADRLPEAARQWALRSDLVRRYPTLLPLYLAGLVDLEERLADALAARMGVDPSEDPYPASVVAAVLGVVRTTLRWWHDRRPDLPLAEALRRNLDALHAGLRPPRSAR